ncbi:MAG: M48 family metallopeptidase [Pseudomonadota bacterium]
MNFFQAQDNARRKTWQLAMMFVAAVVALVVLTNLLVLFVVGWAGQQTGYTFDQAVSNIPADAWLWTSLGVVGVVGAASAYKYLSISAGGRAIAEALGGQLIHQHTTDLQQKRLLNIVEEMAIASGIPVPPVYLIPEASINAFAAGFTVDDAVIGINQGTLDLLNRDELQGVVAHEFSHILNGDTRINLRLIAILHGILFLGMIGYGLMRTSGMSRRNGMPIVLLGVGLLIVGYGGTFFGNLIKAAVSRQREFLADASAVQFTRNPAGIADALKKIGGYSAGSFLKNEAAEQASHMFFGAAAQKFAGNLMATHPPLPKRIQAIQPNWDGSFPTIDRTQAFAPSTAPTTASGAESAFTAGFSGPAEPSSDTLSSLVIDQVGAPNQASLDSARRLIHDSPEALQEAAHDPFAARALVYGMLISTEEPIAQQQLQFIQQHAEAGIAALVAQLRPTQQRTPGAQMLTLLNMSIPALKELSTPQYRVFSNNTARLITADGHVDVFEWVLHRVLTKELYAHFEGPQNVHGRVKHVRKVARDAAKLVAILASHSHTSLDTQLQAYNAGMEALGLDIPFARQDTFDYQRMNKTLGALRKLQPLAKPALIKACVTTVLADATLNEAEGALLQGIAATLDCPLPAHLYTLGTATSQPSS